jgi:hypothetical protein
LKLGSLSETILTVNIHARLCQPVTDSRCFVIWGFARTVETTLQFLDLGNEKEKGVGLRRPTLSIVERRLVCRWRR